MLYAQLWVSWLAVLATRLVSDLASSPDFTGGLICQFEKHRAKDGVAQAWSTKLSSKFDVWLALDWLREVKSVAGLHCSPANELRTNEASALKCTETLI